jgi:Flp pilus assembly protein protease CpaA
MVMFGVATITLVAGMVDDLRSRKVHNALVLVLLPIVAFSSLYFRGIDGTLVGVGSMLLALILTIPLFAVRVIGGGDVKLFAVFALALDPLSMFWTLIYSFFWGGLFGVTRAVLSRQLLALVRNTTKAASRQKIQTQEIHKIPYTFALLLGWLTQLTFMRVAGLL